MKLSSPRFKALAVSLGITFWFFVITSALEIFSVENLFIFLIIVFPLMQILSFRVSKALDIIAIFNTKLFLGILYISVISVYGVLFKMLQIDLLRLKNQETSYWLSNEEVKKHRIFKQY